MIIRNSLLAQLAEESTHGYGLKTGFEASTGGVWPLNVGQVYTTLARLERDGLVRPLDTDDPERRTFQITQEGLTELAAWYRTPVTSHGEREELVIKVLVALARDDGRLTEVLAIQRAATMSRLQELTHQHRDLRDEGSLTATLLLDALILRAKAEIDWLDRCEARLGETRP